MSDIKESFIEKFHILREGKKSLIGRMMRGKEAHNKGWAETGKALHAAKEGDEKEASKHSKNAARYGKLVGVRPKNINKD